ncbi:cytochrome C oxidase subunit II [Brevundimonas sp. 2R-24]|uniref:Cytochrome C oxidase subunit II n=1 Tax=Peiella sedimenti TaxID=3061083 RepID=A0ABT8SM29_9CAUL|nr:cytochrome C oxidase subunit II [Caulobacteraceae bacterium XZ-24]
MSGPEGEEKVVKSELRWALAAGAVVFIIFAAVLWAAITMRMNPPSNIEHADPATLHMQGEFTESNLGTTVEPDGRVTVRMVATQFAFVPNCLMVPQGREVTFRFVSPDVIHGILITGTNVNTMIVPGYVAQVHTVFRQSGDMLMPCHEFCGLGHSEMIARVQVVPADQFRPGPDGRAHCEGQTPLVNTAAPGVPAGDVDAGAQAQGPLVSGEPSPDPAQATQDAVAAAQPATGE